ncbi:SpoIIE family protein phosphatase [Planctomycetota bacterium]
MSKAGSRANRSVHCGPGRRSHIGPWKSCQRVGEGAVQIAFAERALNDGPHCGDCCAWWRVGGKVVLCVSDGLGHGKHAMIASKAALDYVADHLSDPLTRLFAGCDEALRATRGVAMSVAVVDEEARTLTYAAIGSTRGIIVAQRTVRLRGDYGIVGGGYKILRPETVPFTPGGIAAIYTDGIEEEIDLLRYPEAVRSDLQCLADAILQDWGRKNDDAAVLVCA